ncbi:2Fe-2S ferredoxin-type domain-containing protein [Ochromonadaceae sp. CCMP2298]|nr:2Fe-2S ferredoxin-type domain-containing protein [Ochromonadaceae sp. CCMP2298]
MFRSCLRLTSAGGAGARARASGRQVRALSAEAKEWLRAQGYSQADKMVAAFPGRVSVTDVRALGTAGLKALAASVESDMGGEGGGGGEGGVGGGTGNATGKTKPLNIHIHIPHHNSTLTLTAPLGSTFYQLAKDPDLRQYMECACAGIAACSTCHVILSQADFDLLPPPEEAETDMLDLAWGLTATSRLGCQIKFTESMRGMGGGGGGGGVGGQEEGLRVSLPAQTNNLF